jgi:hypothetical protein
MVIAMAVTFLLLMGSLLIGSFATPEFPPYVPTPPTPAPVGDALVGPAEYTIDASIPDRWRRFDFSRNSAVDSGGWDVAFRRTHVTAGPGVGLLDLGPVPLDSLAEVPETGYVVAGGASAADTTHPAIGKWYDYSYFTHLLTSKRHVYAVRTADGRYAAFELMAYYCAEVGTGCITMRYAYQGNGTRRVRH